MTFPLAAPQLESPGPSSFVVELEEYSGPLDLLLSLIRDNRVDIYDIPIAQVADQFLGRIRQLGLDEAAEYLEMAARLLRIKAQMLLPRSTTDDEWEDPRAELVRRLLEYQQVREVVDLLDERAEARRSRFGRTYLPPAPERGPAPLSLSLAELFAAVDRLLQQTKAPVLHDVLPRALDVDGAIVTVRTALAIRARAWMNELLREDAEPWEVLSLVLALLELARGGELRLSQTQNFGPVEIIGDPASEAA